MPATGVRRGRRPDLEFWATLVGVVAIVAVAAVDAVVRDDTVVIAFVLAGPLIAAAGASLRQTMVVSAVAILVALALGRLDDIFLTTDHLLRLGLVTLASTLAIALTRSRVTWEREMATAGREVTLARRLGLALEAGRMGIWVWDRDSGEVEWDDRVRALFGLEGRSFEGTMDGWISRVHPDDRPRVVRALERAVMRGEAVRFDHRAVWPDASVHWLESRGEVVVGDGGVRGAIGVCIDIADRRRSESERVRLLQSERESRRIAERSATTLSRLQQVTAALSRAVSVQGVADSITREGTAAAGAVAGFVALVDEGDDELVVKAAFGYRGPELEPYRRTRLDPGTPTTAALASGEPVFVESPAHRHRVFGSAPAPHPSFAVVPLFLRDERRGVLVFGFSRARGFNVGERSYIEAIGRLSSQALDRAVLYESEQRSRVALRLVLEASERLGALDDPDLMVESVARLGSVRLGRWALVDLLGPRGGCRRTVVAHADESRSPELARLVVDCNEDPAIRKVLETGEPLVVGPDWYIGEGEESDRSRAALVSRFGWRSTILAPMAAGGRTIGVLSIGSDRPEQPGPADVELVEDVARRLASAVQRATAARAARRAEEQWYQQRLEAEHEVVELLQRSILPDVLPVVDGVEIAASYRPVEPEVEIGGDWYDLVPVDGGRLLIVVGDVAGHGLRAAALMGRLRNATRAYAIEDPDPASVLERLDRLVTRLEPGAMVTAVAALHDPATDELHLVRAGHLPPLLIEPGRVGVLDIAGGPPLGVQPGSLTRSTVTLPAGAALLLFTDGLVERRGMPVDEAVLRLVDRLASVDCSDLEALCDRLAAEVPEIDGRRDDVCVVAVRRRRISELTIG